MNHHSTHILIELNGCNPLLLNDITYLTDLMKNAVIVAGATIVNETSHRFNPIGVSVVIVLEESHFSIHTWPEAGYAAADFFTCGNCFPEKAIDILTKGVEAMYIETASVTRGRTEGLNFSFVPV